MRGSICTKQIAFFHRRVVVDEKLDHITRNLRGDGGDVAIHLRVVGGHAAGEHVPRHREQDQDGDDKLPSRADSDCEAIRATRMEAAARAERRSRRQRRRQSHRVLAVACEEWSS